MRAELGFEPGCPGRLIDHGLLDAELRERLIVVVLVVERARVERRAPSERRLESGLHRVQHLGPERNAVEKRLGRSRQRERRAGGEREATTLAAAVVAGEEQQIVVCAIVDLETRG